MISGDCFSSLFLLEQWGRLVLGELEVLPDEALDLADLLQNSLVFGQGYFNRFFENSGEKSLKFELFWSNLETVFLNRKKQSLVKYHFRQKIRTH